MPAKKSSRNVSKLSRNNNINQMRPKRSKRSKRSKRASQKKRGRKMSMRQRGGGDYFDKVATPGYGHKARGGPKYEGDPNCFPKPPYGDLPTGCEKVHGRYKKKSTSWYSGLSGMFTGN